MLWVLIASTAFPLAARLAPKGSTKRIKPRSLRKEVRMIANQAAMAALQVASAIGAGMGSGLLVCP